MTTPTTRTPEHLTLLACVDAAPEDSAEKTAAYCALLDYEKSVGLVSELKWAYRTNQVRAAHSNYTGPCEGELS